MSTADRRVEGAHGSLTTLAGVALYADTPSLEAIAGALESNDDVTLQLAEPPAERVELAAIARLRIQHLQSGLVVIRSHPDEVAIRGGEPACGKLAETLRNLARTPMAGSGRAQPHVDLEFFPGHEFLAEESMWISVYRVE